MLHHMLFHCKMLCYGNYMLCIVLGSFETNLSTSHLYHNTLTLIKGHYMIDRSLKILRVSSFFSKLMSLVNCSKTCSVMHLEAKLFVK